MNRKVYGHSHGVFQVIFRQLARWCRPICGQHEQIGEKKIKVSYARGKGFG
jgi:hypothetical protein